jgi:PGF-CTERM protein
MNTTGRASVLVPSERPDAVAPVPGSVVTMLDISRPSPVEDDPASLGVTVSLDALEANASNLVLVDYNHTTDEWNRLDTNVTDRTDSSVTLEASPSHTSLFAVTAFGDSDEQEQSDGTPTDTPDDDTPTDSPDDDDSTETPDDDPTETPDDNTPTESDETPGSSGPGFAIATVIVALLAAAFFVARRRD